MAKVVFCVPTIKRPYQQCLDSLEASIPLIKAAGWDEGMVNEVGNPYISAARATMLLTLINTEGDVVGGTYRFKADEVSYMGTIHSTPAGTPVVRADGAIKARLLPAGFLKVTAVAVDRFMTSYPDLCYGEKYRLSVDLFNHGAHKGLWWGEDYAFCRRWEECGGDAWLVPDLQLDHHSADKSYPGNFHTYLRQQPGGDLCP
jgi:hypothetical protein